MARWILLAVAGTVIGCCLLGSVAVAIAALAAPRATPTVSAQRQPTRAQLASSPSPTATKHLTATVLPTATATVMPTSAPPTETPVPIVDPTVIPTAPPPPPAPPTAVPVAPTTTTAATRLWHGVPLYPSAVLYEDVNAQVSTYSVTVTATQVDAWYRRAWPAFGMTYISDYDQGQYIYHVYTYNGYWYGYTTAQINATMAAVSLIQITP